MGKAMISKVKEAWEFASAQRKIILDKANEADNIEKKCLIFTANCIADIMDELAGILEKPDKIK